MKVFVSYSSPEFTLAERLAYSLRDEGHSVFFDRASLPAGEGYDLRIREAVQGCNLFIFLVSPESVSHGSYALTELAIAQHKWNSPSGHVLPVIVTEVDLDILPPYLRGVTVLRPQGDPAAEIVAAVSEARRRRRRTLARRAVLLLAPIAVLGGASIYYAEDWLDHPKAVGQDLEPVTVHSSIGNSGWMLTFDIIADQPVKEIFYRFADEEAFKSTGHSQYRDRKTGLPAPRYSVEIPHLQGKRTLLVKYTDSTGGDNGPYTLTFDAREQLVAWTKEVLAVTENSWVAFRDYEGEVLLYFSHLLSYKNGFKEIRYSVDDESLSKLVHFVPDWSGPGAPGISDDDEIFVKVPVSSKFVYVKLIFIDGSEWPAKKFTVAQNRIGGKQRVMWPWSISS
ncbi:MAG: toll/interleukin-1 receptor domain-containing protein [Bryobacteraceae bacterium]